MSNAIDYIGVIFQAHEGVKKEYINNLKLDI